MNCLSPAKQNGTTYQRQKVKKIKGLNPGFENGKKLGIKKPTQEKNIFRFLSEIVRATVKIIQSI